MKPWPILPLRPPGVRSTATCAPTAESALLDLKQYAAALDQLESAFQTDPESVRAIFDLGQHLNNLAWGLATGPAAERDPALAVRMAAFAVALVPGEQVSLNTLGVALYRAGKFAEAITTLEKSLDCRQGPI